MSRTPFPEDWSVIPTWLPFLCLGALIWPPWSQVKTKCLCNAIWCDFQSTGKPKVNKLPRFRTVEERDWPKIGDCSAKGGWPTPSVSWWRSDRMIHDNDHQATYWIIQDSQSLSVFKIRDVQGYHQGVYTCRADNMFGTATEDVTVRVKRKQVACFCVTLQMCDRNQCSARKSVDNFTSSFGRLRQNMATKSVPHVLHDYFSSFNQSNHSFVTSSLLLLSSLGSLRFDDGNVNDNATSQWFDWLNEEK